MKAKGVQLTATVMHSNTSNMVNRLSKLDYRFHQGPEEGRTNGPENISLDRCRTLYEPVDKHPHARREVLTETSLRPCETLGPTSRRVSFLGPTSWLPPATVHDRERLSAPRRIVRPVVNLSVYAA
jgi:hypothetical protein